MIPACRTPVLALLCLAIAGSGDEITLRDGQVVDGEVVSPAGAEMVDVRISAGGMVAVRHIPRDQIASIRIGMSPAQQQAAAIQARRDRLGSGGTAGDWWTLAQDAKRAGDQLQFRSCIHEVLTRDRNHDQARRIIGHVQHRGVWMRTEEQAVAMGQVRFRDQWVSWQDKERILADEAQARAMAMAQLDERRKLAAAGSFAPTMQPVYRAVYWPGSFMGGSYQYNNQCGPTFSLGATGGGNNHRWAFRWNF
jgi:hypothetical protein